MILTLGVNVIDWVGDAVWTWVWKHVTKRHTFYNGITLSNSNFKFQTKTTKTRNKKKRKKKSTITFVFFFSLSQNFFSFSLSSSIQRILCILGFSYWSTSSFSPKIKALLAQPTYTYKPTGFISNHSKCPSPRICLTNEAGACCVLTIFIILLHYFVLLNIVCVCMCMCMCMLMYVYVFLCLYVCVFMFVCFCVCLFVFVLMYVYVYVHKYKHT